MISPAGDVTEPTLTKRIDGGVLDGSGPMPPRLLCSMYEDWKSNETLWPMHGASGEGGGGGEPGGVGGGVGGGVPGGGGGGGLGGGRVGGGGVGGGGDGGTGAVAQTSTTFERPPKKK